MKKKIFRILVSVFVALLLTLSLVSCDALDALRETHAFWTEDGAIMLGDDRYMRLGSSEHLSPLFDGVNDTEIMVTEKDVPLLAAPFIGESFTLNSDRSFMISFAWDGAPVYFCREDLYESVSERIENGFEVSGFCYRYETVDEEGYYISCEYKLSRTEAEALEQVVNNVTPIELPKIASNIESSYSVSMYACSEDTFFRTYVGEVGVSVDGTYYISVSDGEMTYVYYVPEGSTAVFSSMLATYVDNYIFY